MRFLITLGASFLFILTASADNATTGELARELNMNAKDYILWKSALRNLDRVGATPTREEMVALYKQIANRPDWEPLVRAVPLSCSPNHEYITPFKDFAKTQLDGAKAWGDNWTYAPTFAPAPTWAPSSYNSPYMNYSPTGPSFSSSLPNGTGGFGSGFNLSLFNNNTNKNLSLNKNGNGNLNKNGRK